MAEVREDPPADVPTTDPEVVRVTIDMADGKGKIELEVTNHPGDRPFLDQLALLADLIRDAPGGTEAVWSAVPA